MGLNSGLLSTDGGLAYALRPNQNAPLTHVKGIKVTQVMSDGVLGCLWLSHKDALLQLLSLTWIHHLLGVSTLVFPSVDAWVFCDQPSVHMIQSSSGWCGGGGGGGGVGGVGLQLYLTMRREDRG